MIMYIHTSIGFKIIQTRKGTLVFYIFDILFFNGHMMVDLPLINRKQILEAIPLPKVDGLQICQYTHWNGKDFFAASTKMNIESAKNKNSLYSSGRSNAAIIFIVNI